MVFGGGFVFVVAFGFFVHLVDGFQDLEHGCGVCVVEILIISFDFDFDFLI